MSPQIAGPADLHMHSECSDGTEAPAEVVRQAGIAGLRTIALTDHDTVAGWDDAARASRESGIALLPGAEVSSKHRGSSVHVLAYLFDPDHRGLSHLMARVRDDRVGRAERIARNLARDLPVTWEDVLEQRSGDATIGRPHIADALVARGIVKSRAEAFAGPLHPASPYYVSHAAPTPLEAVIEIARAGGVSIIAHPAGRGTMPEHAIRELLDAGLAGFELGHRENTATGTARLQRLVEERDLIVTGSSDYHGAGKPNRLGENTTDPAMVARIVGAATGSAPVV
ncbi:PHP domain-containing protein [Microbacterium gubbeenense]|uniref:PHP domain-containing protein n=2 Tax=Microbacterium gubbeenense TaxID=159896 RepID=UPI003F99F1CA